MSKTRECYQNKTQDERLSKIEGHIDVINSELGDVKTSQARSEEKINWLVKTYWVITTASLGALIAGIFNLIVK